VRLAAVLTQLTCGACLLIGTVGLVLVLQNRAGGVVPAVAWLVAAMAGLVFGGLIYRGGLIPMLAATAIDAGFGIALITTRLGTLRALLRILPEPDVATIGQALAAGGIAMLGVAALCLVAVPQGLRYARWFRDAAATRSAQSTARGFPPPPVAARGSVYIIPAEAQASRRRLYLVLGGVAIGIGAGVGVLVSSMPRTARPSPGGSATSSAIGTPPEATLPLTTPREPADAALPPGDASLPPDGAGEPGAIGEPSGPGAVQSLIDAQRAAIAHADVPALAGLVTADVFGFGVDADEVAEGRDAVAAQLARDLGEPPAGGFTVESTALSIGEDRGHAWIAQELAIGAGGREPRKLAITELAAVIDGRWRVVALHWATPVDDATALRLAVLKTLPAPGPIRDRHDGSDELDQAARAAFASRAAFAEARSERPDAFNYGSGGERARGGAGIKRIFTRLKAQIRVHDGVRVVGGGAWDPAQRAAPWIAWAAVNVDFTARTRAATDVTQTFRVLAILIKEGADWRLVQTQWSNGGPIGR